MTGFEIVLMTIFGLALWRGFVGSQEKRSLRQREIKLREREVAYQEKMWDAAERETETVNGLQDQFCEEVKAGTFQPWPCETPQTPLRRPSKGRPNLHVVSPDGDGWNK